MANRYIQEYLASHEVAILIKEADEQTAAKDEDLDKELGEDLISVIYSFSGKLYGRRAAKIRKIRRWVQQAQQIEDEAEKEASPK